MGATDPLTPQETVLAQEIQQLTRSASWNQKGSVLLQFPTHHPQGMAIVGNRFFLSSVEVLDRKAGKGKGHLFEVDFEGRQLRSILLGEEAVYHPGGIDFDGQHLWVPVAEYRPDSRSFVYRVDPESLVADRVFEMDDHIGALVCSTEDRVLVGVSWGSRRFYRWDLDTTDGTGVLDQKHPVRTENPAHFIDLQDGQFIPGTGLAVFSGFGTVPDASGRPLSLGGIELIDIRTLRLVHQVPCPLWTIHGQPMTRNPMAVRLVDGELTFYFLPEDNRTYLHTWTVSTQPEPR